MFSEVRCRMFEISQVPEFEKDMDSLVSKFPTINSDLERFKKTLVADSSMKVIGRLPGEITGARRVPLHHECTAYIYKARRFYCKCLNCTDRIRVIYAYNEAEKKFTLIEIYFKNGKQNEDKVRILNHFGKKKEPV